MNNQKYESPEIQAICIEPDESIMDYPTTSTGGGIMP